MPVIPNASSQAANGDAYQAIQQGTVTNVTTTASSATAVTFGANTDIVRISASKACYILIKDTATTVTSSNGTHFPDGAIDYFVVCPAQVMTVIWESEAGILSITEGL